MARQQPHETVGVIVVHGIGEQRRFEHLDGEVRELVQALRARPGAEVTVEIRSGRDGAFQAASDTWNSGPEAAVRVVVREPDKKQPAGAERLTHIHFHEVWWADVNERFSLSKQIRFWFWGLSVWLVPPKPGSNRPGFGGMLLPTAPAMRLMPVRAFRRLQLFCIGVFFAVGAASVGMITFLAERLLGLGMPDWQRVLVNYVSGVKLYSQQHRLGGGFVPKGDDFLDTMGEPPRVSIRRRMIRAIADVALQKEYDRWYILAHSLGTVVACNGLMEPAHAWPGYFEEEQWQTLSQAGLAGPARPGFNMPPAGQVVPRRPVWLDGPYADDVAYRSRIFEKFRGILTFGSPLEKFAAIWPAQVAMSSEPVFQPTTRWINVYDPIDPVSGVLEAYADRLNRLPPSYMPAVCPVPENVGYAACPVLLLAHIRYFTADPSGNGLADKTVQWLLEDDANPITTAHTTAGSKRWFQPLDPRHRRRRMGALAWWTGAFLAILALGAVVAPLTWRALHAAASAGGSTAWQIITGG